MELSNLTIATILSSALAHPYMGHGKVASDKGFNQHVDWQSRTETVPPWVMSPGNETERKKAAEWHGGGFKGQMMMANAMKNSGLEDETNVVNGVYKLLYPATIKKTDAGGGDIQNVEEKTGNKRFSQAVALSALSDILRGAYPKKMNKYGRLDPWVEDGASGLMWSKDF